MKTTITLFLNLLFTTLALSQAQVSMADLESLNNTSWSGTLMYVNYGDGQEVVLKTTMQIQIKGDKIIMNTQFTDEPQANSKSGIKLKKGGTYLGKEKIIERVQLKNNTLKIVTTFEENDENQPATLFKTYIIGQNEFSITKRVEFKNSNKKLVRNRYTYNKI